MSPRRAPRDRADRHGAGRRRPHRRRTSALRLAPAGAVVLAVAVAAGATAAEPWNDATAPAVGWTAAGAGTEVGAGTATSEDARPSQGTGTGAGPGTASGLGTATDVDGLSVRAPSREAAGAPAGPGTSTGDAVPETSAGAGGGDAAPTGPAAEQPSSVADGDAVPASAARGSISPGTASAGSTSPGATTSDPAAPGSASPRAMASPVAAAVVEGSERLAVTVTSPVAGAELPRGCTVVLAGSATSAAEATVVWTLKSHGTVLQRGPATVEGADGFAAEIGTTGTWEVMLDLPVGSYSLEVQVPDDSDGEGVEKGVTFPATTTAFTVG